MDVELVWRLLLGQLMFVIFSITGVFRSGGGEAKGEVDVSGEPIWILVPLRVAGLVMWGSVVVYLFAPGWSAWARYPLPQAVRIAGLCLSLSTIPLILWMFKHVGLNLTVTVQTRRDHELIKTGPYRWIRHPLYTFAGGFFVGLGIASACWLIALALVVGGIFLVLRLPLEEQGLIDRFGDDYRVYMEETGAFFPKWS